MCLWEDIIRKKKGYWEEGKRYRVGRAFVHFTIAAVPGAQANLTYMYQRSHNPAFQLFLPDGIYIVLYYMYVV